MSKIYHIAPKRTGHAFVGNMIKSWCPGVEYIEEENITRFRANVPKDGVIILQTRDLLNWIASYTGGRYKVIRYKPIRFWLWITREIYYPCLGFDRVNVIYDKFFVSQEYRRCICSHLNGIYNEEWLNRVTDNQDGSSFDNQTYDGRAQEMKVLERYTHIPEKYYRDFFSIYPEHLELYKKIDTANHKFLKQIGV